MYWHLPFHCVKEEDGLRILVLLGQRCDMVKEEIVNIIT